MFDEAMTAPSTASSQPPRLFSQQRAAKYEPGRRGPRDGVRRAKGRLRAKRADTYSILSISADLTDGDAATESRGLLFLPIPGKFCSGENCSPSAADARVSPSSSNAVLLVSTLAAPSFSNDTISFMTDGLRARASLALLMAAAVLATSSAPEHSLASAPSSYPPTGRWAAASPGTGPRGRHSEQWRGAPTAQVTSGLARVPAPWRCAGCVLYSATLTRARGAAAITSHRPGRRATLLAST